MEHLKTPRGYAEDFDPVWYLDNYIKTFDKQIQNGGIFPFAIDFMHETFKTGNYKGAKLLDLGTGPTVHSVISASRHVTEIHLSDISPRNREILENWRTGTPNSVEMFQYICKKENEGMSPEDRATFVRNKVTQIINFDMRLPDPFPGSSSKYDIVISSLLLCSITKTKEEFTDALKKTIVMIKPAGYLIVFGVLNCKWYQVGEFRFSGAPDIDRGDMKGMFMKENLKILDWRETSPDYEREYGKPDSSDEDGAYAMIAQKI